MNYHGKSDSGQIIFDADHIFFFSIHEWYIFKPA